MFVQLGEFALVVVLLTALPGIDMALVTRSVLSGGRTAGWATTLGLVAGVVLWGFVTGLGLSALILRSPNAYQALRYCGAAYLFFLGVRMLARRRQPTEREGDSPSGTTRLQWFRTGLVTDALNPKMGAFYFSAVPQFVHAGQPVFGMVMLFAGIHCVIGLVWFGGYTLMVARTAEALKRSRLRSALERMTGAALIALGLRLAFTSR